MNNTLVTVAVITYNSSKTLLDTLDSISVQTYPNIEVVISDDCSTDNTIEVCKKWIDQNKDKFQDVRLLTSKTNKGIAPNVNQAVKNAKGEWIKLIAADDFLLPSSIESFCRGIREDMHFIVGNFITFDENREAKITKLDFSYFNSDAKEQLENFNKGPITIVASMMKKDTIVQLGYFDERFPMMEDFPFIAKALENNIKFDAIDETVVYYRVSSTSVQRSPKFHHSHVLYVNQVIVPKYKKQGKYIDYWHDKLWSKKELLKLDNKGFQANLVRLLMFFTDIKEWKYIVRDNIYRPIIFKYRSLKK